MRLISPITSFILRPPLPLAAFLFKARRPLHVAAFLLLLHLSAREELVLEDELVSVRLEHAPGREALAPVQRYAAVAPVEGAEHLVDFADHAVVEENKGVGIRDVRACEFQHGRVVGGVQIRAEIDLLV